MPYVSEASFDVPECRTQHHFSRMSCECATRPGAHAETLSGRLPGHPPSVFRTRQVSPSAPSGKSLRKPPELATRSECLAYTSRKPRVRRMSIIPGTTFLLL